MKKAAIRTCFYDKRSYVCCLETVIAAKKSKTWEYVYSILSESLQEKPIATVKSKKYLTDFTGMKPVEQRNSDEALPPRYKNVQLMQGLTNNKPDFRIQVKGLFGTKEKRFEVQLDFDLLFIGS